ncbi:hypothetical protein [Actinomadura roseirufa]|uniref:hypothetical protein n=1 Tax=Actinomadura roseirufa TaxID=2094049 RepID=UPI001041811C|nr:hypothetical protein [Actinomadura roseirufa]
MSESERGRGGTGDAAEPPASTSPGERLTELATLLRRRFSGIAPILPHGTEILHLIRSGKGPHYVVWARHRCAYLWYCGPDHGAQIGTTADQAAATIGRTLGLPPA